LGAIGLARRQLVAAAALRYALVGAIAAAVSSGVAVVLSPLAPFGLARLAEPDPGVRVNAAVIAGGALIGLLLIVLIGAGATWIGTRARADRANPSTLVTRLSRAGASASAVVGTRFALEPGRGAAALPVRTTLTAGVMAAAALATAVTFSAGFDRVLATPRLQGAPWDIILGGPQDDDRSPQETLGDDPRVGATARIVSAEATAGGSDNVPLTIIGVDGDASMLPPVVRGRHPARNDEVALTNQSARRLRADVGDVVAIGSEAMDHRRYRVVGMVPIDQQLLADRAGQGVLTTRAAATALAGGDGVESLAVRWRPGVDELRARNDMKELFGSQVRPFQSPDVRNLTRVRWLPSTLAIVLAAFGLATLGHSLFAAVRRRTRDLALLKTLGFDRAQVARTVRWQAATSAAVAAVVGLPIGVAVGRWAWRLVGERIGVVPEPVTPWLLVLALAPALLALAMVVGIAPSRVAARTSPAEVLRAE
jgi:ABC-type lipoprotein release transport system permease subunit